MVNPEVYRGVKKLLAHLRSLKQISTFVKDRIQQILQLQYDYKMPTLEA